MTRPLDDTLAELSRMDFDGQLAGIEGSILSRIDRRRRDAEGPSKGVQIGLAAAAVALGLIFGLGSASQPSKYAAELQVLSDDSGVAPSIRLGGA